MFAGVVENGLLFRRIGEGGGFRAQLLRQPERGENRPPFRLRQAVQRGGFNIHRMPDAPQPGRQPGGGADQLFAAGVMADAQQNGVAGMPDFFLALTVAPGAHLLIDPIGGTAQRQLAQGDEVALAKEVLDGPLGLAADIDFSLIEPLTQIVGGQVHQHHIVGGVEKRIRDGFANLHAGDAADDIVQALEVLDVNGGKYVNAGFQQLFDVLPAFRMTRAGRVAVRQLIDQNQRRATGQRAVKVKLLYVAPAVGKAALGQGTEPLKHCGRLFASVGFRHANQNIQPLGAQPLRFRQHRPGFTDPGAGAKKYL